MRRFALIDFQITATADSKLSYTPCYSQYGLFNLEIFIYKHKQNEQRNTRYD